MLHSRNRRRFGCGPRLCRAVKFPGRARINTCATGPASGAWRGLRLLAAVPLGRPRGFGGERVSAIKSCPKRRVSGEKALSRRAGPHESRSRWTGKAGKPGDLGSVLRANARLRNGLVCWQNESALPFCFRKLAKRKRWFRFAGPAGNFIPIRERADARTWRAATVESAPESDAPNTWPSRDQPPDLIRCPGHVT